MQVLSLSVLKKLLVCRVRMKVSYMAFNQNLTVMELFLKSILKVYREREEMSQIKNPWPKVDRTTLKLLLMSDDPTAEGADHDFQADQEKIGQDSAYTEEEREYMKDFYGKFVQ